MGTSGLRAVTLDWGNVDWTTNAFTQAFDIDASNPGNDIRITFSGDTASNNDDVFAGSTTGPSPDDTTFSTGGITPAADGESLYIQIRYADNNNGAANDQITVTIDFLYTFGVQNVTFTVFDVDDRAGEWEDRLDTFRGYNSANTTTSFADLTGSVGNNVANSGTASASVNGTADVGPTSGNANVAVVFNDATMNSISFRWTNQDAARGYQWIAIHNITYTPVPEPSTWVAGGLLTAFVAFRAVKGRLRPGIKPTTCG
ncbi:MAG: hypothetical protein SFU85_08220 [Candidatus Methylacidiphilales bacterium]|nr:hypothetical protein [Candidatus Methylacidiphilales bacterium]